MKVIVTGATGMVGEGVLHQCLVNPQIEEVLSVSRKSCHVMHAKLKELLVNDFYNLAPAAEEMLGYDAVFFCLGTTSLGKSTSDYYKITFTLTLHFAETIYALNPQATFIYVSGAGTDTAEKGKGWQAIKGKTENAIMRMFPKAYAFRPGFMRKIEGAKNVPSFYKYVAWTYSLGRILWPNGFNTLEEVGDAMIYLAQNEFDQKFIYGKDITLLAKKEQALLHPM